MLKSKTRIFTVNHIYNRNNVYPTGHTIEVMHPGAIPGELIVVGVIKVERTDFDGWNTLHYDFNRVKYLVEDHTAEMDEYWDIEYEQEQVARKFVKANINPLPQWKR